jgi:hypothetical protein
MRFRGPASCGPTHFSMGGSTALCTASLRRRPKTPRARRIRCASQQNPDLPLPFLASIFESLEDLRKGPTEPLDWTVYDPEALNRR